MKQPESLPARKPFGSSEEAAPTMTRMGFGQSKVASAPAEEKKDEGMRRPTFTKQVKRDDDADTGFISRSEMAPKKEEEKKTEPQAAKPATESTAGPWRSTGAQGGAGLKPTASGNAPRTAASGAPVGQFSRGPPRNVDGADKKNDKGDDSWSAAGNFRKGPPAAAKK